MPTESDALGAAATPKVDPTGKDSYATIGLLDAWVTQLQQQIYALQSQLAQSGIGPEQRLESVQQQLTQQIGGLGQQIAQLGQQVAALQQAQSGNSIAQQLQSLQQRVGALEARQGGGSTPAPIGPVSGRTTLQALGNGTAEGWATLQWPPSRVSTSPACQVAIYGTNFQMILRGGLSGQSVSWTAYR